MYLIQRQQFKSLKSFSYLRKKKVLKNVFVFSALSRLEGKERSYKKKGERRQHRALRAVGSQNGFPGKAILSATPGNKLE